jgi:uncharacterized protein YheU (UPF0270 family)
LANPWITTLVKCTWTFEGEDYEYIFKSYSADVDKAIQEAKATLVWSKLDSFKAVLHKQIVNGMN